MNSKTNFLERALIGQNEWWKYIIILIVAFFGGSIIGSLPLIVMGVIKTISSSGTPIPNNFFDSTWLGISYNLSLALNMLPFVFVLALAILMIKLMHKRTFAETVNGTKSVRWGRSLLSFTLWFVLMAVYYVADYFWHTDNYVFQFDVVKFIPLLVISLIMIPIQTSSEEFLMRGYLAQGVGSHTHNRWFAVLVPSIVFALLHSANPEVGKYGFVLAMAQYWFFGLFFGVVAVLDDGVELTMGAHAANNIFLSLFMTNSSSALQTDAIFEVKNIDPLQDLLSLVVIAVIVFFILYKKYNWNLRVMNKRVEIKD